VKKFPKDFPIDKLAINCSGLTLTGMATGMLMMMIWLIPTTMAEWLKWLGFI